MFKIPRFLKPGTAAPKPTSDATAPLARPPAPSGVAAGPIAPSLEASIQNRKDAAAKALGTVNAASHTPSAQPVGNERFWAVSETVAENTHLLKLFALNTRVRIETPEGTVAEGWTVLGALGSDQFLVQKGPETLAVLAADLLVANPEQIPRGESLFIRRGSSVNEDGWHVTDDVKSPGFLVLKNSRGDTKEISAAEVVDLNVYRLLGTEKPGNQPIERLSLLPQASQLQVRTLASQDRLEWIVSLGVSPGFRRLSEGHQLALLQLVAGSDESSRAKNQTLYSLCNQATYATASPARQMSQLTEFLAQQSSNAAGPSSRIAQRSANFTSSSESLDLLMAKAWQLKSNGGVSTSAVMDMYRATGEPNPLTRESTHYIEALSKLAQSRPKGTRSNVQSFGMLGTPGVIKMVDKEAPDLRPKLERTFFRFESTSFSELVKGPLMRVFINASADTAPEFMNFIVKRLVDSGEYPGIALAKVLGPATVSSRGENIIIYMHEGEVDNVLDALENLQGFRSEWFKNSTPAMTQQVLPGVAIGAEPLIGKGDLSFSEVRARAIADAAYRAQSPTEFQALVRSEFTRYQVDPDRPHLNLRETST